jgi:hypothetical protein
MGGACRPNGGRRGTRIDYWKESQRGRRTQGRPRRRQVNNIKMDLGDEMWLCGLDWSGCG